MANTSIHEIVNEFCRPPVTRSGSRGCEQPGIGELSGVGHIYVRVATEPVKPCNTPVNHTLRQKLAMVLAVVLMQATVGSAFAVHIGHPGLQQTVHGGPPDAHAAAPGAEQSHVPSEPHRGTCFSDQCTLCAATLLPVAPRSAAVLVLSSAWTVGPAGRLTGRYPPAVFRPPRG